MAVRFFTPFGIALCKGPTLDFAQRRSTMAKQFFGLG
jgi:hypothetical protein